MIPKCIRQQVATVAIRNYAAHSYIYYVKNNNVISDGEFDELCKFIYENFDWMKPYDISGYLDISALQAGTGYNIASKVCGQTLDYALSIIPEAKEAPKQLELF